MKNEQLPLPFQKMSGMYVIPESTSFALMEFDQALEELQQKLYYMSLAYVEKGEDPKESPVYKIDIHKIAEFSGTNAGALRVNMEKAVRALSDMDVKLKPVIQTGQKLTFTSGIYQSIIIDPSDPYYVAVRFNYDFREQILRMKEEYDIEFPTQTIMKLDGKYTIPLYTMLITEIAILRNRMEPSDMDIHAYTVRIERDVLMRRLGYTANIGTFNRRTLPLMIKDINEKSEIFIENGMPEFIKEKRSIVAYEFRVRVTTSIKKPIFAHSILGSRSDLVPDLEYLIKRLKEMKVAESLIKNIKLNPTPDLERIWGNLLYTWYQAGKNSPAYFNKSYHHDWYRDKCSSIERMFRLVMLECPDVADERMRAIDDEYTKRGIAFNPKLLDELAKRIRKKVEVNI